MENIEIKQTGGLKVRNLILTQVGVFQTDKSIMGNLFFRIKNNGSHKIIVTPLLIFTSIKIPNHYLN